MQADNWRTIFALALLSTAYASPGQTQSVPRDPYVVDSNGKVIGRFYITTDPFVPNDRLYAKPDYAVFALKPSGVVIKLGVLPQGFVNLRDFEQYFLTTDCTGEAYLGLLPEDSNLIRTAYVYNGNIIYPGRGEIRHAYVRSDNTGDGTSCRYLGKYIDIASILSVSLSSQRFTPPFSFKLR